MSTLPLFDEDDAKPRRSGSEERVYRVSALNRAVRTLLEDRYRNIWVEGELSDVTHHRTGHVYFTLNDEEEDAQIRGVMFRSDARRAKARLQDGERVKLRCQVSLYEARGSYQIIARIALPVGLGELHAQFERTRKKLEGEGLLDDARKRSLPMLPRVVGVVTSSDGAALHDIIRVAHDRCPTRIVVAPCKVQGTDSPRSICSALAAIQELPELDLVIVGRGGGAAEDLFAFNDEKVARAIAACRVPIVSAVGHEVDVTIADLVADLRAATPSNAAELAVPERQVLLARLATQLRSLQYAMDSRLDRSRMHLDRAERLLTDPRAALSALGRRLDQLEHSLRDQMRDHVHQARARKLELAERLSRHDPRIQAARSRARLQGLQARLRATAVHMTEPGRAQLAEHSGKLNALSPLAILARGYAIAVHESSGKALVRANDAAAGDRLTLRLHEGELGVTVDKS